MQKIRLMVFAFLTALLSSCIRGTPPEVPGDILNDKLSELINQSLDAEMQRMTPAWSANLLPAAADNARAWLTEISEVVARCRYGPGNHSKFNLLEYDITLGTGEVVRDVQGFRRCNYESAPPLVMRARFLNGKVVTVTTDGRERKAPVDHTENDIRTFASAVLRADQERRRSRYYPPPKTQADIEREWRRH